MTTRLLSISRAALANALAASLFATAAVAQDSTTTDIGTLDKATADKVFPTKPPYSPYAGRNFPTRPYFGDTHTHTSFSMDAGAFGARLGPKDAYRFAKGEEVMASSGQRAKLSRPLDFIVVTDHSDGMGFFPQLLSGDPTVLATPQGRKWYDQINSGQGRAGRSRHHHQLRQGADAERLPNSGHARLPQRLARNHQGGGGGKRARPLHRLHRL